MFVTKLKGRMKRSIVAIGCATHIMYNFLQNACDLLPVDVEALVFSHLHSKW
jgi:hypothetical protein